MTTSTPARPSALWRVLAIFAAVIALVGGSLVALSPPATADVPAGKAPLLQRDSSVVTADALPTVQINDGYVWAQTMIGNTVYAVGSFTNARAAGAAPGTQLTPRSNILAYDITTGNLKSFAPTVTGVIRSVVASADGSRIYIGGSFNSVNGQTKYNVAALDATTGALISTFNPSIGGTGVYALALSGGNLYAGGLFSQANGVTRRNLAAFATSNGALQSWAPTTDLQVDAMVTEPGTGKIVIGGRFYAVNGQVQRGLANLDPATGAINTAWLAPQTIINGMASGANAGKAGIFGLTTDANGIYGTGWVYADVATGNLEGVFAADAGSGAIRWVADCHGDHYGVYSTGTTVYSTSHTHACETVNLWPEQSSRKYRYIEAYTADARGTLSRSESAGGTYKDWSGTPSPSAYTWYPDFTVGNTSGLGQAGLSITGTGNYISVAGEFGSVNNQQFQGLVRFSTTPSSGSKQGPRIASSSWTPTATAAAPGAASVSIAANWDRDDLDLTYELYRSGTSAPVLTRKVASTWWDRPTVTLADLDAPAGNQTYTVRVKDANGNTVTSQPVSVTVAAGTLSAYSRSVLSDGATLYWPLGSVTSDYAGTNNPVSGTGVATVTPGATTGSDSSGSTFNGSTTGLTSSTSTVTGPNTFSVELWIKTATTRGGKLVGFGSSQTGSSSSYDRHVYMLNNGRLTFGVYPNAVKTVTSSKSYNDNAWHHVVATLSSAGMALYVDGELVGTDASVTSAQAYNGYWRVGGDNLGGWPDQPTSQYFAGSIDDVSVYGSALTQGQVQQHYAKGLGLTAPTASFTATPTDLALAVNGSASTAGGGRTITSYAWDFGDGHTGTGSSSSHTYETAGTYTVTLSVTDSAGLVGTTTRSVTVQPPNVNPTAAFTTSTNGLTAAFNASGSVDSDGTIASYAWDFGDDSTSTVGPSTAHKYEESGTYTVTLTVTDDRGGSSTVTHDVVVEHAAPVASFGATANGLTVAVDASTSSASDDASLTYSWNFGDSTGPVTGRTASHTFVQSGTYTVTLTVTDSLGGTASKAQSVTVASIAYVASDSFERSVGSGWSSADTGGPYTVLYGAASAGSVGSGTGNVALPAGQTRNFVLQDVSVRDSRSTVQFTASAAASTGSSYVGITSRQSASQNYTIRVWLHTDRSVWLVVQRSGTVLASQVISGLTWVPGETYTLKTEVDGTSPTTLRARVWRAGTSEPSSWQISTTDSTAALQQAGWVALHAARAGSATASTTISFDDFRVQNLQSAPQNTSPVARFESTVSGLSVAFDGSPSSDAEGAIASYSWNFGDDSVAVSGVKPSYTYSSAGTYTVTLKVTDSNGSTHTVSHDVTVVAAPQNTAPVARFESSVSGLAVDFDGSSSSDAEGAIASYSWNFGDDSAAVSGEKPSYTYSSAGTYTVTLKVTDAGGLTHSVSHDVTVVAAPQNTAPVARFESTVSGLSVAFDGSASSDAEGSIASYSWNFGDDSAPGSGAKPSHTYLSPGTYTATLKVTDAGGLTHTVSHDVTVAAPPTDTGLAADEFGRTVASGWGTADVGGAWTVQHGAASSLSVADGAGQMVLPAGQTRNAVLNSLNEQDVEFNVEFSLAEAPSSGNTYVGVVARQVGSNNYQVRVWLRSDGSVWLVTQRGSTVINSYAVPGITRTAGDTFTLRAQVFGNGTTTIRAQLWRTNGTQPSSWQVTSTDTTAALQTPGAVGLHGNRAGAATSAATITFDDFEVTAID